jgi:hypothetical protein
MPGTLTKLPLCLWHVRSFTFGLEKEIGRRERRKDDESSLFRVGMTIELIAKVKIINIHLIRNGSRSTKRKSTAGKAKSRLV